MEEKNFEDNNTNVEDIMTEDVDTNVDAHEEVDVEKLKETNRRLYARLKEAESEAKKFKSETKTSVSKPSNYEADLLRVAKGYDDEQISTLEVIAKGRGISLIQASQDPMFQLTLDKREAEEKVSKAKLGASKGSSQHTPLSKVNMNRDDHMKLVKEQMSNLN